VPQRREETIYRVRLCPLPHVNDPIKALRAALKTLLRRFGLKALSIEVETGGQHDGRHEEDGGQD
jgi:hypothetical protein